MKYFLIILTVFIISCQKEETKAPYFPVVPAKFSVKGDFSIDLPDMKSTNVKEVRLDIRNVVNDTFKITILGRDKFLYLTLNYDQAIQTDLMTWIVKGNDCLNTINGHVNEPIEGYVNIIYYK
jgi:hypothetical protein